VEPVGVPAIAQKYDATGAVVGEGELLHTLFGRVCLKARKCKMVRRHQGPVAVVPMAVTGATLMFMVCWHSTYGSDDHLNI